MGAQPKKIFLVLLLVSVLAPGCASQIKVPEGAKLIWYGKAPFSFESIPIVRGSGQMYLYDDDAHRVVSVVPIADKSRFEVSGLENKHNYALYFVPDLLNPGAALEPASRPAH